MKGFKGSDYSVRVPLKITLNSNNKIAVIKITSKMTELYIVSICVWLLIFGVFIYFNHSILGFFLSSFVSTWFFAQATSNTSKGIDKLLNSLLKEINHN